MRLAHQALAFFPHLGEQLIKLHGIETVLLQNRRQTM